MAAGCQSPFFLLKAGQEKHGLRRLLGDGMAAHEHGELLHRGFLHLAVKIFSRGLREHKFLGGANGFTGGVDGFSGGVDGFSGGVDGFSGGGRLRLQLRFGFRL